MRAGKKWAPMPLERLRRSAASVGKARIVAASHAC